MINIGFDRPFKAERTKEEQANDTAFIGWQRDPDARDLALMQVALGKPGDDAAPARERAHADPFRYLLMVDEANRPLGWVDEADIPTSGILDASLANPVSPIVNKRTTLKDALSMMLDADVQAAIVVDRTGALQGVMTVERVARLMREGEHGRMYGVFGDED